MPRLQDRRPVVVTLLVIVVAVSCAAPSGTAGPSAAPSPTATSASERPPTPLPSRVVRSGHRPVAVGEPIAPAELSGRIVFDDYEAVFVMDVDGSNVVRVADRPGQEFDGDLSPDGRLVAYRDSTRGINEDDEIFVVAIDGTDVRNVTRDPANDWGPAWSPDGTTIAFNSDRDGGALRGYLVAPDGSGLRAIDADGWVEYPSFSPDGTRIAYMGHHGGGYDIFVAELASGATRQLTHAPGDDGWPAWSPDGTSIAFTSERDDCAYLPADQECWSDGPQDAHRDVWLMDADGANQRRVTPELGQFVAWSPDGRYILVSGRALYVVRPDGTGRFELRADGIDLPLGGIPDWG